MQRLEDIKQTLRDKGWVIRESTENKNIHEYICQKVSTLMIIQLLDNKNNVIPINEENTIISAISIKDTDENIENKPVKAVMSRKIDMLSDLISLTKMRIDIIYEAAIDLTTEADLTKFGFKKMLADVSNIGYYRYYHQGKTFPAIKKTEAVEPLKEFKDTLADAGSTHTDIDKIFAKAVSEQVYSVVDLDFLHMYVSVAKKYYETENEDYDGIYNAQIEKLSNLQNILEIYINAC